MMKWEVTGLESLLYLAIINFCVDLALARQIVKPARHRGRNLHHDVLDFFGLVLWLKECHHIAFDVSAQ